MKTQIHSAAFGPFTTIDFTPDDRGVVHLPGSTFEPYHWPSGYNRVAFDAACRGNLFRVLEVAAGVARCQGGVLRQLRAELSRVVGTDSHDLTVARDPKHHAIVVEQARLTELKQLCIVRDPEATLMSLRTKRTGAGKHEAWEAL